MIKCSSRVLNLALVVFVVVVVVAVLRFALVIPFCIGGLNTGSTSHSKHQTFHEPKSAMQITSNTGFFSFTLPLSGTWKVWPIIITGDIGTKIFNKNEGWLSCLFQCQTFDGSYQHLVRYTYCIYCVCYILPKGK